MSVRVNKFAPALNCVLPFLSIKTTIAFYVVPCKTVVGSFCHFREVSRRFLLTCYVRQTFQSFWASHSESTQFWSATKMVAYWRSQWKRVTMMQGTSLSLAPPAWWMYRALARGVIAVADCCCGRIRFGCFCCCCFPCCCCLSREPFCRRSRSLALCSRFEWFLLLSTSSTVVLTYSIVFIVVLLSGGLLHSSIHIVSFVKSRLLMVSFWLVRWSCFSLFAPSKFLCFVNVISD
jgi:hypothetical protein